MIDLSTPNEWQLIDPDNGLVMPWYTHPLLEELKTWDLKDRVVFEYGCGASSLWWAARCKKLYGVESSKDYFHEILVRDVSEIYYASRMPTYAKFITRPGIDFDIVVIDGAFRDDCVPHALKHLKPGGYLIFDNWMQPSVELQAEETQRLLLALPHKIYKQPNHPDWQTAVFTKL